MDDKHILAMDEISRLNEKGGKGTTKVQGGKTYTNVVTRVEVFRKHYGMEYGIETAPLFPATGGLFMQAWIKKNGEVYGTGHAYAKAVSAEKGIEKLETTAIGRALASIGLSGGEYASDTEMESWKERYEDSPPPINIDLSGVTAEDLGIAPTEWIQERMENLQTFVVDSKAPTMENFNKRINRIEGDGIFKELGVADNRVYLATKEKLETKLKERLNG